MALAPIAQALGTSVQKLVLNTVIFVASTAYQINLANKLKREADKRKGFRFNKRGESTHIPIVYGKQAVGLIEANHKVNKTGTDATVSSGGTTFNSKTSISFGSGTKNEFLNMNGAICQGGIDSIRSIEVDGSTHNQDKKHRHRIDTYTDGLSSTAALGAANNLPDYCKFTDLAHADLIFRLNRDDYNYQGIPSVSFFVKGRKVRDITYSNNVYSFSSTRTYSNNPALVLADYLTYENGRNIGDAGIDLESFYVAKQICDNTVLTGAVYSGSVNDQKRIEDYNVYADFPDTDTDEPNEAILYRDTSTGDVYAFTSTGTEENPAGNYSLAGLPTRNIPLYECNIVLDSEAKVRDNIEAILGTMPLAVLTWSSDGRYKLKLAYPSSETDFNTSGNAAEAHVTFNKDNVIRDTVNLSWLAATERFNQATVTFLDEHEDFKENSVTWPKTDLTTGSAYLTLLASDNNQPMTTSLNLDGITDPYHAEAYAEFTVRQSRTFHTLSFTATKAALGLEPGDFVKVHTDVIGSNVSGANYGYTSQTDYKYYKVNSVEVNEDLTVKLECHFVDLNAFAWNIADDYIPQGISSTPNFDVEAPTNVSFSTSTINNLGTFSGTLTWTGSDDSSVINYIVQVQKYDDQNTQWGNFTDLGIVSKETTSFEVPGLQAGDYRFGVRAISNTGALSSRTITTTVTLAFSGLEKLATIYADGANQDTNTQSYTQSATDTHYALMVYLNDTTPTLPVRSSSSVSDATDYTDTLSFNPITAENTISFNLYKRSSTDITGTAVSGGTYNFSTNTLTPPSGGWTDYIPAGVGDIYEIVAKVTGFINDTNNISLTYETSYPALHGSQGQDAGVLVVYADDSSGTNATTTYTDEEYVLYYEYVGDEPTVSEILTEGTSTWVKFKGENGPTGASTNIIFQRATSQPNAPAASSGIPTNWYDDASNTVGTGILWASSGTKAVDSTNFTWGTPFQVEGEAVAEVSAYRLNSNAGASGGSFNFTTNTLTPPTSWSLNPPSLSADGDIVYRISGLATGSSVETSASISWGSAVIYARRTDGATGQGIYPIYSSVQTPTSSSQLSFSPTNKDYVTFYESTTQPSLTDSALLSQTYIKYKGEDGDPAGGYVTTRAYIEASSAPSTGPDATITWSTLAVALDSTDAANGWTLTQPTIDADSTTDYYFSDISFVDATGIASSTTATGSNPTKQINFDGVVSFTDLSTQNASTVIHGGNITTGSIQANIITVGNVTVQSQLDSTNGNITNAVNAANTTANAALNTANAAQADATAAVNAANAAQATATTALTKTSVYYQNTDPANAYQLYTGDTWQVPGSNTSQIQYWTGNSNNTNIGGSWSPFDIVAGSVAANYVYAGTIYTDNLRVGSSGNTTFANASGGLSTLTNNLGTINAGSISGTNLKAGNLNISNTGALTGGTGMYASSNGAFGVGVTSAAQYISFNPTGNGTITMAGTIVNFSADRLSLIDSGVRAVTGSSNTFVPIGGSGQYVFAIMGGGGGGGSNNGTSNSRQTHDGACGGGAGGFAIGQYTYNGNQLRVTIGAGGNGGSSGSNRGHASGNAGGASYLYDGNTILLFTNGGSGGGQNTGGAGGNATSLLTEGRASSGGSGGNATIGNISGGGAVDCFGTGSCSAGNVATLFANPYSNQGNVDAGPPYETGSFTAGGSSFGAPSNIGANTNDSFTVPSTGNTASAIRTRIAGNTGTYNNLGTYGPSLQPNVLGPGGSGGTYFGNYDQGNTGTSSISGVTVTTNNSNSFVGGLVGAIGAGTNNVYAASGGNTVFGGGGAGGSGGSDSNSNAAPTVSGGSAQYGGGGGGCGRGRAGTSTGGDGGDGLFLYLKL